MIIVTTGHTDREKAMLLQAITGVNADRLPEEEERGVIIDLGYAYWPQPNGRVLGFIDVPRHERFLSDMLAGVDGIDHILLVVARGDGVMAQTREHLQIPQLTNNPQITVVLTKADRVDEVRIGEVHAEIQAALGNYGFTGSMFFIAAANEGRGIEELRDHLLQLMPRGCAHDHSLRLAIGHTSTVKGAGLVVTGTTLSGEVNVGDMLWLTGVSEPMRIRSLHAQNQVTDHAQAGQRITLNITSNAQKEELNRGDWLLPDAPPEAFTRVIVSLEHATPLTQWQPLHIHHVASHVTGRISLLEGTLAELISDTPLRPADNDRLMSRDISAQTTLTGACIVTLNPPRRGKRKPEYLQWLSALKNTETNGDALVLHLTRGVVDTPDFTWVRQFNGNGIRPLIELHGFIQTEYSLLNAPVAARWQREVLGTLVTYHEQHRDESGPGCECLRRTALPVEDEVLVLLLIKKMRKSGTVHSHHDWLYLPEHKTSFSDEQLTVWQKVKPSFGNKPWWVRDLAKQTGTDEQIMRVVLRQAAQQGIITAIVRDRYYHNDRIVAFTNMICELDQERGSTCAAGFHDRLNVGRKLAIQVLEYFDHTGFTHRQGNDHLLHDALLFPEK